MTREEAIKLIEHISIAFVPTDQYGDYDDPEPYEEALQMAIEALSAEVVHKPDYSYEADIVRRIKEALSADAEQTDCTEFVNWLLEKVMDEENWELNAVAYGEVIVRKLKKLGLLEVKDGYYVQTPSINRPTGEWLDWLGSGNEWECSACKCSIESHGSIVYNYCPMCGAKMKGENHD